eukprot:sb/3466268/
MNKSTGTGFFTWPQGLTCQYDADGLKNLVEEINLTENEFIVLSSTLKNMAVNPGTMNKVLGILGIHLTEGLVGALIYNIITGENGGERSLDLDRLLLDAVALERYLMYNNCREDSNSGPAQRANQALCSKILKLVVGHSKTLQSPTELQRRYRQTLISIPTILNQYILAVKGGKPIQTQSTTQDTRSRPASPFQQAPILPPDYPPVGMRNQDAYELREARRKKLRLRWSQIASPCQLKDMRLNTVAHSNNLHVWSLNERRKDLVQLPRLALSELSKHPSNLTIEDVTELRGKIDYLKMNYYKSYLNATEMGTEEHWTELLGHEIYSPVLQQVTRASFQTYSNPKYNC